MFNKEAPTIKDSAIINEPGIAYVKNVEKILSWILRPMLLNKAPIAIKLAAKAIAGLFALLMQKKTF